MCSVGETLSCCPQENAAPAKMADLTAQSTLTVRQKARWARSITQQPIGSLERCCQDTATVASLARGPQVNLGHNRQTQYTPTRYNEHRVLTDTVSVRLSMRNLCTRNRFAIFRTQYYIRIQLFQCAHPTIRTQLSEVTPYCRRLRHAVRSSDTLRTATSTLRKFL